MIRFRPLSFGFQTAAVGVLLPCLVPPVHAQTTRTTTTTRTTRTLQSTADTEIARRQNLALSADDNLRQGDAAMIREDYEDAVKYYRTATDSLSDSPATGDRRRLAMKKFFDASIKLAEVRIVEARYPDAETVAKVILRPEYDPNYAPALELLQNLEDPSYYNQTLTPKQLTKVQLVKKYLLEGSQYYDTGRYDLAFKRYEQVLALDAYNDAARRGEERVDLAKAKHGETTGYPETRGRLIAQTSNAWDLPIRRNNLDADPRRNIQKVQDTSGTVAITRKLQSIIIPNIEFRQTTLNDAVEFLRQEAHRLDVQSPEEERGVNIFLKLSSGSARPAAPVTTEAGIPGLPAGAESTGPAPSATLPVAAAPTGNTRISLTLTRIPLYSALDYVAKAANLKIKVEPYVVDIVPLTEETGDMITLEMRVPPSFIGTTSSGGVGSALNAPATSATGGGGASGTVDNTGVGSTLITKMDAKTFLESSGVTFPPGASAVYLASTSKLVVRNTQANIDLVQSLVSESIQVPKQVEIESKFIEVTQNNLKELGFDWTLGQFNIGTGSHGNEGQRVFAGGGSSGNGTAVTSQGFPFAPGDGLPVGQNPVTAGNRSGTYGISANALDALLLGTGAAAVAPGIFSIAGVFTDPQFQVVIHALNQQKGVDLLSAPRVTAKSGQKATIEIIREFIYPTQFQPPQIPQSIGATGNGTVVGGSSSGSFPVTPTTPTAFEKRNTGVTLEVDPVIGPDNFTIDLTLQPQVVDFDGFINYGSPIQTVTTNALGVATTNVLTQNTINQPVFSVRKVSTSVSVYDGSTVVLGGLVREDIQKVNDKVPIIGDLPLIGRLFRSKIDQNIKRNLIIFVTARLIDPSGQPLLTTSEDEEDVAPLSGPDNYVQPPGPLPKYYKK